MNKYNYLRLEEVCNFISDKVNVEYLSLNNYISTENMLPHKAGVTQATNLPNVKTVPAFKPCDILTSNIRPYFKKIWFANKAGGCSNDVLVIRANDNYDSRFLFYVLADDKFFNYSTTTSKGTKMPRGEKTAIMNYEVPKVDLPTQHKIATILSAYDNLIENNNRRIAILEEMAQRLYREWFMYFRFPGHEEVKMVESEIGLIPERWKVTSLNDIISYISRGISPKYSDAADNIVLNQKCIRNQRIDLSPARGHISKVPKSKIIQFGDVLINSTGVGTLGRVAQVLYDLINITVDSHVSIVRPATADMIHYLGLALCAMQPYFEEEGVGSTGQTELSQESIKSVLILIPDKETLASFNAMVSDIRVLGIQLRVKNENLRKTRDLLLPRLISGELDVSKFDISVD
jgi:type I restriction enzyme, S subunit